ncbi:MAG: superinfection immunity protein [Christensenellales bacterium]|jgi:membrane protein DedA with SNARE-associated domain
MVWRDSYVVLATVLGAILAVVIYFIPSYLAFKRKHPHKIALLLLNIFLGWTFLGYLIALVWALYPPNKSKVIKQQY